jgi:Asp-tRNA(Asn)/Glu-tRNA(Gln) amidotransferase C subunit
MANQQRVTRDQLKAVAELLGLDLDLERIDLLRPGCDRLLQGIERLAALDLSREEPATVFVPRRQ